jgi:hypothetical protein
MRYNEVSMMMWIGFKWLRIEPDGGLVSTLGPIKAVEGCLDKARLSSYRVVNTLPIGCTNQSVNAVKGNKRCLF